MGAANRELLSDAIARNSALVLSLPSAGLLRHHKSRFLREEPEGIWVEASASDEALIGELVATGKLAGLSFKNGITKVIFATPVLRFQPQWRLNDDIVLPAVMVAMPENIKAIQRRNHYRVRVFADCDLSARLWRIAPRVHISERPQPSQEIPLELHNLSMGGIGVTLHGEGERPPKIDLEDRLRVELKWRETGLLLEGRMRAPTGAQTANSVSTGIRFKEMDSDLEGRQKLSLLTRILGEMQREEARRTRQGLA